MKTNTKFEFSVLKSIYTLNFIRKSYCLTLEWVCVMISWIFNEDLVKLEIPHHISNSCPQISYKWYFCSILMIISKYIRSNHSLSKQWISNDHNLRLCTHDAFYVKTTWIKFLWMMIKSCVFFKVKLLILARKKACHFLLIFNEKRVISKIKFV